MDTDGVDEMARGDFTDLIENWLAHVRDNESVMVGIAQLASHAIEEADLGIDELIGLIDSARCRELLMERVTKVTDDVVLEFSKRQQSETFRKLDSVERARIEESIRGFIPKLSEGKTFHGFLRGLVERECFGKNQLHISGVENVVRGTLDEVVEGLITAAMDTVAITYGEVSESSPVVMRRFVNTLVRKVLAYKHGITLGLGEAEDDLGKIGLSRAEKVSALADGFKKIRLPTGDVGSLSPEEKVLIVNVRGAIGMLEGELECLDKAGKNGRKNEPSSAAASFVRGVLAGNERVSREEREARLALHRASMAEKPTANDKARARRIARDGRQGSRREPPPPNTGGGRRR